MSQTEKAALYKTLKRAGITFDRHYREYSTEDFQAAVDQLQATGKLPPPPEPATPKFQWDDVVREASKQEETPAPAPARPTPPEEHADIVAGRHAYRDESPLRTDEQGNVWYREEVTKPAVPKPRARRVLDYVDPGTVVKTISNGQYTESFEVAGDQQTRRQVKITMPSYQVGVYKAPNLPFRVHVYNDNRGFDLFEVQEYYGGGDLVPSDIKRIYVGNDLCYDINSTIRTIEAEYRRFNLNRSNA